MKRVLLLLAQSLAVQAAAVAEGAAPVMGAKLPVGTGPIAAKLLEGVNLRTLAAPPEFVNQLQMPSFSASELSRLKPASAVAMSPSAQAEARGQVRKTLAEKIRGSGILGPIAASSRKKHNETYLADVFAVGVLMAFDPSTKGPPPAVPGGRRLLGWWDDMWDAVGEAAADLGCGAFATGAVPGYLASYGLFHSGNSGYSKLNGQQKFFQRAGGFSTELLNKVNVKYGAWMAPGFGSSFGVTMGTEIYIKAAAATSDTLPITNMSISPAFLAQTRLLMHEMGHSKQYSARSWKIGTFGWDYLYNYCKAGFDYAKNSMEVDAETYTDNSDAIMIPPFSAHFKKWRKSSLESTVGYSKSPSEYTNFKIGTTNVMSLDLVKTSTKTGESQRKKGTFCVRVLSGTALATRTTAEIPGFAWDCVSPTMPPTRQPTRKPTFPDVIDGFKAASPTPKKA